MPEYVCEKCLRVFKQKSGYDDHQSKKKDCSENTVVKKVIENVINTKVKEAIIQKRFEKPPITKETLPSFFEDLHNLLWNKAGLSPERALEHMTFFFAYRLIEQQADTLHLPQECRWSYIASLTNENDLFDTIKKGVTEFRKRPKTKPFFKPHEIQKVEIVFDVVQHINRISISVLKETDTLGDIFEYMIGRGMSTMSDEGQYFTNRSICKLAFQLAYSIKKKLRREDGSLCTCADWFCGTGGFPAEYVKGVKENIPVDWKKDFGSIYCQDMSLSNITTTLLNLLILTGISFIGEKIRGSNSFYDPITMGVDAPFQGLSIDYLFMNPPYGGDKNKGKDYKFSYCKKKTENGDPQNKIFLVNSEIQSIGIEEDSKPSAGVQLAMATLSEDGGVACIVLPQGLLGGTSKHSVELRKKMVEEYKIWYVVDISSNSFINTKTKTSMVVFQKGVGPTEKISFMNLDETVIVEVSLEELRRKQYYINYRQYLPQIVPDLEGFDTVMLGDICELVSGYAFKSELFTSVASDLRVVKIKNIKNQRIVFEELDDRYPYHEKLEKYIVKEGEFVIAMTGQGIGKVGLHTLKERLFLNQRVGKFTNFKESIDPRYVYYYIRDNQERFMDLVEGTGTARDNISPGQILSIQIPIPSLERQQQIIDAIDGWSKLAHDEEQILHLLEKQIMFQVKEMGRGQPLVKLGDILIHVKGKRYPVGDGKENGKYPLLRSSKDGKVKWMDDYTYDGPYITVGNGGVANFRFIEKFNASTHTLVFDVKDDVMIPEFAYYSIQRDRGNINERCFDGSGLENLKIGLFMDFEIPVPPLSEQRNLQQDFDEIGHKHRKIAYYKEMTKEAIHRLLPGNY